jgi:hypothetical protein
LNLFSDSQRPNECPCLRFPKSAFRNATWIGLFLSLFAMLLVRQTVAYFSPTLTFPAAIWKESLIWVSAIVLLILVRRAVHVGRLPYIDMVEIGSLGIRHCGRVRDRGWRAGCAHRLWARPRLVRL